MKQILLFTITALIFSSCKLLRTTEMLTVDDGYKYAEFKTPEKEYKIAPYDKLTMMVSTNDGFQLIGMGSGSSSIVSQATPIMYPVEFDGQIKLPILGRLTIAGLTLREAEKLLEEKYSKFYKEPFVIITVSNRKVYVFKNGGTIASTVDISSDNFSLIDAIVKSGGLSESSKSFRIRLIRGDVNNNPQVFLYNIFKLKELQNVNILLEANDIIYVESRPRYMRKILEELSPYLSLISTVLLVVGYTSFFKK